MAGRQALAAGEGPDAPEGAAERSYDAYLGIGRKAYGLGWWALALWVSGSSLNIAARAQHWGFKIPFGAEFKDVPTDYRVAAYGIFGGVLLWIVLAGLILHGATWGKLASHWPGRVPAAFESIANRSSGPIPKLLQLLVILLAVIVPLYLQGFFVAKFLAGTAYAASDARVGLAHLGWPPDALLSYRYDNRDGFAYCEFVEPWAAVGVAAISYALGLLAILQLLRPRLSFVCAIECRLRLAPSSLR